jgi:hypothetical protein
MSSNWEHTIRLIRRTLHPSERLKAVLKAITVPPAGITDSGSSAKGLSERSESDSIGRLRFLVLVSHEEVTGEQASLLVLRVNPTSHVFEVQTVVPICGEFTISTAQAPNSSTALSHNHVTPASSTKHAVDHPHSSFVVTIKAGFEADALSFQTDDVVFLNLMLKECKRLKELADAPPTNAQALQTYSWLAPYAQKDQYPHACKPVSFSSQFSHTLPTM